MIFIKYNSSGKVNYVHYMPFHERDGLHKTKEELEQEGILLEQLPARLEEIEGKSQELYYIDSQIQWQYEDIPPTPEEAENKKIAELETALLEITTISALQQAQNEQAIMELTMMMIGGM